MQLLSHFNSADKTQLGNLDDNAPFQFLPQFTEFYKEFYKQELFIVYSKEFDAYLPLRIHVTKIFTVGQILHAPVSGNEELVPKDQLIFFNALLRFIKEKNICDRLIQPHPYGILSALPPYVQSCEFGTYVIDLSGQTVEQIFAKFHPKYQKAVSHSQKNNAEIKIGWNTFNDFYEVYSATMKRVNMSKEYREYFNSLHKHMGTEHVIPGVVYDNGYPIGSAFFIFSKYAAFCTHAGSQGESKLYGAMKLLHFEMIKYFKKLDVRRYDLVGVRLKNNDPALEGIFRFKKGFGGDLKAGYLWKKDVHPLKLKVYDFLMKIRTGKEGIPKDIIDQLSN